MEEYVARALSLMEDVAQHMTSDDEGSVQLAETSQIGPVVELAERHFGTSGVSIMSILLNSLLAPAELVQGRLTRISFGFQILHEFFLASWLAREGRELTNYPELVRSLHREIVQ